MSKDNNKSRGAKAKAYLLTLIKNNPEKTVDFINENKELLMGMAYAGEKITQAENDVLKFEEKLSSSSLADLNDNELQLLVIRENAITNQNSINGKIKTLLPISKLIAEAVSENPQIRQIELWNWLKSRGCNLAVADENNIEHITYNNDKVSYSNLKNRLYNAKKKYNPVSR